MRGAFLSQVGGRYESARTLVRRFLFLRVRLLPVVIFWSVLLLSVKVNTLWHTLSTGQSPLEVRAVFAENPPPAEQKAAPPASEKAQGEASPSVSPPPAPKATVDANTVDSMPLTREQFQTLLQLSDRQKDLQDKTQTQLPREKAALSILEKKIAQRTQSLEKTQKSLTDLLNTVQEKENVNTQRLVKMIEGMKAKEASQRLEVMDFEALLHLMEQIKPGKASAILANMAPEKAGYLMSELSKRRQLLKDESASPDQSGTEVQKKPSSQALPSKAPEAATPGSAPAA